MAGRWLPLKQLAAERGNWEPLAPGITGFEHRLMIPQWQLAVRLMIYRKHVRHQTPKNFQLDLFTPDDGYFEYYAVATNMPLGLPALFAFVCGRGAQVDAGRSRSQVYWRDADMIRRSCGP